jgi:hypothetical protein
VVVEESPMKRKKYLTREEKILDSVIGFVGFFVLNTAIYLLLSYVAEILADIVGGEFIDQVVTCARLILPWAINIGLLVFCAWWRSWIAIGALSAFGYLLIVLVVLVLLAGVCLAVGCLAIISVVALREIIGVQP